MPRPARPPASKIAFNSNDFLGLDDLSRVHALPSIISFLLCLFFPFSKSLPTGLGEWKRGAYYAAPSSFLILPGCLDRTRPATFAAEQLFQDSETSGN